MNRCEVAVAAPLSSTLTYSLPEGYGQYTGAAEKYIGRRVLVPLGKRLVTGYILGSMPDVEVGYSIKKIKEILDGEPLFHANCIPFFRWIAYYYHYPLGEVISTALPAGLRKSSRRVISLYTGYLEKVPKWPFVSMEEPDWYIDLCSRSKLSHSLSREILSDSKQSKILSRLVDEGVITIRNELSKTQIKEKEEICFTAGKQLPPPENLSEVNRVTLQKFWLNARASYKKDISFSSAKALYYFCQIAKSNDGVVPQREILKEYKSGARPLKDLADAGILKKTKRRVYRNPLGDLPEKLSPPKLLSEEQKRAVGEIRNALMSDTFTPFLLFGVTGGGKTEVYLKAAEACLSRGRDVLVLVPEIALATQLESHFISRFPGMVALLHSGLSQGERFDQWSRAAGGMARIVIGARSAVFAPLKNLGLIVVDEEHDAGFKQDDGLRYNGRDLAVLRARKQECTVILGSATPSVISYHNAVNGKYRLLKIDKRIGSSTLPDVSVFDLNRKSKKGGSSLFNQEFIEQININLQNSEQSLVLINRRGFSASYLCQECGTAVLCRDCNVSLTYHKHAGVLKCHYCGYLTKSNLICDNCHSDRLVPFGVGTERVEEELRDKFPDAVFARLDSDTASDRKRFIKILQEMKKGEIDILIGTQMIAKGHHFPNVTFVGVVWADGGLNMPDFRAAERTYQLLSQVTGRAGRGEKKGRVIIQTMRPAHYAIEFARTHRYDLFYEKEIEIRRRPSFPPFVRLIQLKIHGPDEFNVRRTSLNIATLCRNLIRTRRLALELLGPATAPLEKIKKKYRWQILVKGAEIKELHLLVAFVQENKAGSVLPNTVVAIDIDPENMM